MGLATLERVAVTRLFLICSWRLLTRTRRFPLVPACLLLTWVAMPQAFGAGPAACSNSTSVILLIGAPGEPEYRTNFLKQASLWEKACAQANCRYVAIGSDGETNARAKLERLLACEPTNSASQLWLVLIGHGTFDGKEARFNLPGPDLGASEFGQWLKPFQRPVAVIDSSSSSAPFLNAVSATNRVVVTATRSGYEQNFARFGQYFAAALTDPTADLDKDGQVSILEAFLAASRQATEFYKAEGRLVTEHALLDDNGDGLGTQADWFRGLRAVRKAKDDAPVDGVLSSQWCLVPSESERRLSAEQRARRDALVREIIRHREKKQNLSEDEYYRQLEVMLLELARVSSTNSSGAPAQN